ncbi:unnamed protein product [Ilex paraguariensis]|uniref:PPIase cyclophilin-type domain-containing protein n=1 Tax=Ilex paraguariensis TaxID=185542 RepID=A0ABC8SZA5_9AQUA
MNTIAASTVQQTSTAGPFLFLLSITSLLATNLPAARIVAPAATIGNVCHQSQQYCLVVSLLLYCHQHLDNESPKLKHDGPGLLSMAIADRDTHGSLFNITFKANHHLDRKYVVFGKLVRGHEVLKKIENAGNEEGRLDVTVKIIYCGEIHEAENPSAALLQSDKRKVNKLKMGTDASSEANSHEARNREKHRKSLKERRKKRRYYTSESDTSSDTETELSESDTDSDSYISSSTDISSSSDDRRGKKKKSSKRDKYRRGKKRDRRREKKRRRYNKRSKRRSKRALDGLSESGSESSSEDDVGRLGPKHKTSANKTAVGDQSLLVQEKEAASSHYKNREASVMLEREEGEFSKENGEHQSNRIEVGTGSDKSADRQPDVVDDHPGKSRFTFHSSRNSVILYAYRFFQIWYYIKS